MSAFFKDNYNIDVKIIRDAEVGTLMESMDLVMVGAEAVLKNGGIINKVATKRTNNWSHYFRLLEKCSKIQICHAIFIGGNTSSGDLRP